MDLTGKLLIAMPGMEDPRFAGAVVLLCTHGTDGAMGLIVNKPAADLTMAEVLGTLDIQTAGALADMPVYFGGPVETSRGFVLHSPDYASSLHTLEVARGLAMTATQDVLEDIAAGRGPEHLMVALGYAGWGPGQLEDEIAANGWLTAEADAALVFGSDDVMWAETIRTLGIEPSALSGAAGRA